MLTLFCRVCGENKPTTEFHRQAKSATGHQFRCKTCDKKWHAERYIRDKNKILAQSKEWRANNKEKDSARSAKWRKDNPTKVKQYQRSTRLKRAFGLSLEEYERMCAAQCNVCFICGCEEIKTYAGGTVARLSVDHCHTTGRVRKLLCTACNTALGGFEDNPELLRRAALYVEGKLSV